MAHQSMQEYLLTLTGYHAWAFGVLFEKLDATSDLEYRDDAGLFFRSLHGTLNHLLVAEQVWFARLAKTTIPSLTLDQTIESDRTTLQRAISDHSANWANSVRQADNEDLHDAVTYTNLSGNTFSDPPTQLIAHVVNHASHHRGQMSAVLSRLGHPTPEMDMIFFLRQ